MSVEQAKFIKILQRELKQVGEANGRNFQSILLLYLQERLLFRLSISKYHDNFILKGGLLVHCLIGFKGRPTRDVDLLAQQVSPDIGKIESIFREICQIQVEDGVYFNSDKMNSEPQDIGNNAVIRITVTGFLGRMKAWVKIDLSFEDVVCPAPLDIAFPVLLNDQARPQLKVYSLESSIAEKFQAIIFLSEINTRMKDFYDIYSFANNYSFNGHVLLTAVKETFLHP